MHTALDGRRPVLMSCQACRCLRLPGTFCAPHGLHRSDFEMLRALRPGGAGNPFLTDGRPLDLFHDIDACREETSKTESRNAEMGCLLKCSECGEIRPHAEFAQMEEDYRGPKFSVVSLDDSGATHPWQKNKDDEKNNEAVSRLDDDAWFGEAEPLSESEYYDVIEGSPGHPHAWQRRLWAWHVSNRELFQHCGRSPFKPRRISNMLRLLEWDGLVPCERADLLRQLGCFEESSRCPTTPFQRMLCSRQDCLVRSENVMPGKTSLAEVRVEWGKARLRARQSLGPSKPMFGRGPELAWKELRGVIRQNDLQITSPKSFADYAKQEVRIRLAVAVHGTDGSK